MSILLDALKKKSGVEMDAIATEAVNADVPIISDELDIAVPQESVDLPPTPVEALATKLESQLHSEAADSLEPDFFSEKIPESERSESVIEPLLSGFVDDIDEVDDTEDLDLDVVPEVLSEVGIEEADHNEVDHSSRVSDLLIQPTQALQATEAVPEEPLSSSPSEPESEVHQEQAIATDEHWKSASYEGILQQFYAQNKTRRQLILVGFMLLLMGYVSGMWLWYSSSVLFQGNTPTFINSTPQFNKLITTEVPLNHSPAVTDEIATDEIATDETVTDKRISKTPAPEKQGIHPKPSHQEKIKSNTTIKAVASKSNLASKSKVASKSNLTSKKKVTSKKVVANKKKPSTAELLATAYNAYLAGDLALAEHSYQQVLQKQPKQRDALLGVAAVMMLTERRAQAMDIYFDLLSINPKDDVAKSSILSWQEKSDVVQVESEIKQLQSRYPASAHLDFSLGNLYAREGRWANAQQAYFDAWSKEKDPHYAYNLAVSLDHLNQPSHALTYYQKAEVLASNRSVRFSLQQLTDRTAQLIQQSSQPSQFSQPSKASQPYHDREAYAP